MNQWPKVSDEVKDAWASLLERVDRSQLLIVARGGQNPVFRDRIIGEFVLRGVQATRIRVSPALDFLRFLELFSEIDISLDPFPYGGGTTTMQSLWMISASPSRPLPRAVLEWNVSSRTLLRL